MDQYSSCSVPDRPPSSVLQYRPTPLPYFSSETRHAQSAMSSMPHQHPTNQHRLRPRLPPMQRLHQHSLALAPSLFLHPTSPNYCHSSRLSYRHCHPHLSDPVKNTHRKWARKLEWRNTARRWRSRYSVRKRAAVNSSVFPPSQRMRGMWFVQDVKRGRVWRAERSSTAPAKAMQSDAATVESTALARLGFHGRDDRRQGHLFRVSAVLQHRREDGRLC